MQKIAIIEAVTPGDLAQVANLLRDYLLWMRRRYRKYGDLLDSYFDAGEWESELADLGNHYGAPFGAIVLALVDGMPAGCVMMRGIGEDVAEMKRLFVRPAFQGLGLARAMVKKLTLLACDRGYPCMRLETGALQTEAQSLYKAMGFKPIEPYYAVSLEMAKHGYFFEKTTCRTTSSRAPEISHAAA
jgi:ribosomal protein S18 acetylase RimI-like enzyme